MRIEEAIGARLKAERERQGLTLDAVGTEMGKYLAKPWTAQAVWQAERGQRDFRAAQLLALALVLEIPVVQLLAPIPARGQTSIEVDEYTLTAEDSERLFMAVAAPGAAAVFVDLEQRLDAIGSALGRSIHQQKALQDQLFEVAETVQNMIDVAVLSPKVQARIQRNSKKRDNEDGKR